MPRTSINYSNASIYKLCCKDINITEIYVGHTTDMRKRKYQHKNGCSNENNKNYNMNVYQFIRNNGGWDNWDLIEIEKYNATDGYDAKKRERYWIEELKATLNMYIPSRTKKEYNKDNKESIKEKNKEYRENNKEIINKKNKEWRECNKEYLYEKYKEWHKDNKDKVKDYDKNRKNKVKRLEQQKEKITCECGCIISRSNLAIHKKTKKHIDLMSRLE